MIEKDAIFNDYSINIFTDASVRDHEDTVESVAGALLLYPKGTVNSPYIYENTRILNSTNNEGEIYAILMGINLAIRLLQANEAYRDYTINLFSDSRICIFGLREWYSSWISNGRNNQFMNSSGQPVANQEIFIQCMNLIMFYNLKINFYHIRGHKDPTKKNDFQQFSKDFMISNYIKEEPSRNLVLALAQFNDYVDYNTRGSLLPEGVNHKIPTIVIGNGFENGHYHGTPVNKAFLFTRDMRSVACRKKEYRELVGIGPDYKK